MLTTTAVPSARPAVTERPPIRPATVPDLREHHRRPVEFELFITDLSGQTVLRCKCLNLSAGGLYATAPVGYGLAVGQRYELRISPPATGGDTFLLGTSLGYATIIRTQIDVLHGDEPVGFAMRFDSAKYLPV